MKANTGSGMKPNSFRPISESPVERTPHQDAGRLDEKESNKAKRIAERYGCSPESPVPTESAQISWWRCEKLAIRMGIPFTLSTGPRKTPE